jgi:RNA-directed DNA polymerase
VRFPRATHLVICCKSQKGAERVLKSVIRLLENELGLKVHPEKTNIINNREQSFVFLGHEFKPGFWMTPSPKAMEKFKERVKEITRRNQTVNVEQLVKKKLNPYLRGWGELLWTRRCQDTLYHTGFVDTPETSDGATAKLEESPKIAP